MSDADRGAVAYDDIVAVRMTSAAWRLLRADNAPLILSFLGRVFVHDNIREISATELVSLLDDELYLLGRRLGADAYPKTAKAYLDDWASPEAGWLRKYYVADSDEAHYDATPAVEKAVGWIASLRERSFVGTESRLNTVFDLLRQMVYGTETDPEVRLADLRRRRGELDAEIDAVERGDFRVLDAAAQRDRYQQFADTSRALLGDLREVEGNFRNLDRQMRERITTWRGTKGELLDEFVGGRNLISDSDQGRSFQAFHNLLLSEDRRNELTELIRSVQAFDEIAETDSRLGRIHYDWLDAGARAQATVRQLSERLRRFLDDQVWLENRRVMDVLRNIEAGAIGLRDHRTDDFSVEIDAVSPAIVLPMERPMYRKPVALEVDSTGIESGQADGESDALYEQIHVDPLPLIDGVRRLLRGTDQVTLVDVVAQAPLTHGLAELITYLSLDDATFTKVFDADAHDTVSWTDAAGSPSGAAVTRTARVPRVIYLRRHSSDSPARTEAR